VKVLYLFGPNLGSLGTRDPERYGTQTLAQIMDEVEVRAAALGHATAYRQTEREDELASWIAGASADGFDVVVINPGALGHYATSLADAIATAGIPAIEVHMTNIYAREEFRRHSVIAPLCRATIAGAGAGGYHLALEALPWITS
jgi:3-dehydroquinate dehydratase-2